MANIQKKWKSRNGIHVGVSSQKGKITACHVFMSFLTMQFLRLH